MDARFWLFMGVISNTTFQLGGTLSPMEGTNQFNVNLLYWCFTFGSIFCLIKSFWGNFRYVGVGLILHTTRNILPMLDLEQRRELMGMGPWGDLMALQAMGSVMNIMIMIQCYDRGTVFLAFIFGTGTYLGLVEAFRGVGALAEGNSWATVLFCIICF